MYSCTFFGHRHIYEIIDAKLDDVLTYLIVNKNVRSFYVGNNGDFDFIVKEKLKQLKNRYPYIEYTVVLAYLPKTTSKQLYINNAPTVYPEGLESIPPKFAICKRNLWMIEHADYVITYVNNSRGGAGKFEKTAKSKGKTIINISNL